jgi:hypothetical protein
VEEGRRLFNDRSQMDERDIIYHWMEGEEYSIKKPTGCTFHVGST